MKRRDFILLCAGAAAARPGPAAAQKALPLIGFLNSGSPKQYLARVRAFHDALSQAGFVAGRTVAIEYRWGESRYDRLPALAAELVRLNPVVIASTGGTPAALAAQAATRTIPIVFQVAADPVAAGLVASLSRPGGNITGVTNLNVEVGAKRLELLHELLPAVKIFALLVNPANPPIAEALARDIPAAGRALGLEVHVLKATSEAEFDAVFAGVRRLGAGALMISPDSFFNSRSDELAALALRHRVPAVHAREFVEAGGLLSYGGNLKEVYRRVGDYTARILKGEQPGTLPVQQAATVELVVNLKTAKAFGITVPLSLLGRADELIE